MDSKRPSNNFDNPFARAIFKTEKKRKMKSDMLSTNVSGRRSKTTHSSVNDIEETPPIQGEE